MFDVTIIYVISAWFCVLVMQEIFQVRDHKDNLTSIAISTVIGRAASAGDNRSVFLVVVVVVK